VLREEQCAVAIGTFGSEANRFRVYIPIDNEDLDERFDQAPFFVVSRRK
jgi:hypothetical protein